MSSETVEVVIAELIFRPEDEIAALDNDIVESTIAFARASPAGIAQNDGSYKTTIKNVYRFKLVSHGLSFRQTANTTEAVRATFNLNKRTGINDNMVDLFVRVLVGVSIQKIGDLLATDDLWAMSMGFDGSSHRRMRHTANHQVVMLKKQLSAVYPSRELLLRQAPAVSTHGEPTNMGRINCVQMQLVGLATHDIWRVPHQKDLVVKSTTRHLDGCQWIDTAFAVTVFLRRKEILITDMGVTCPKKTNRCMHLSHVLAFLIKHENRIVDFFAER
ncbi:hypothetical protein H310_00368 [Aphanomyces invadans]|uniref:Uncharacterized protein n=1 Tax=Aphanomyces invadans TaxID=157072 RepID=A0A024UVI1_9STRA|nr:hypothetical protein H310_00368 [Aphanomyces invadans]ETW09945.1 hypothetical protein H310_00368 [Aphanomyces invadans]|eukprot:XP_008861356.1 hypothetical protein H310_00368 [Aphanomyces invadans]